MVKPFHTAHRWDLEWQDDVDVLSLRSGVQVKVFHSDPELGLADMLIKFPPGYGEPEHAHESSHSIVVLEGVQIVKGVHLHPGDYVWASGPEPHGPYEYPEGCVVFASFRGLSPRHRYQVARFSDTGPRGAVIETARIAVESACSLVTLPCRDFSAAIRISALV